LGGILNSANAETESSWSSFRVAIFQMLLGQILLAALVFSPLKISSVPAFLKDWIMPT
jgi:hypothetical protein